MSHDAEEPFSFSALPPACRLLLSELTHFLAASGERYVNILASELKLCREAARLEMVGPILGGGG